MFNIVSGSWWTNYILHYRLCPKICIKHAVEKVLPLWNGWGDRYTILCPRQRMVYLLDSSKQLYCRIITVAACQGHTIWIRNYSHGNYVLYNSKTTDLLCLHGWIVKKMNQHDTWKPSWGFSVTVSEWIRCWKSKVNFCLRCKKTVQHIIKH